MSETSHPLGKLAPLQLPVEPAAAYAGEEHFFNQQWRTLISLLKLLHFIFSIVSKSQTRFFRANLGWYDIRWSLGSLLFLVSWAFMMGPWTYIQHLTSTPRLPFTVAYFGSIGLTLYFSLGVGWQYFSNLPSPADFT
jgi:hypothetical protein